MANWYIEVRTGKISTINGEPICLVSSIVSTHTHTHTHTHACAHTHNTHTTHTHLFMRIVFCFILFRIIVIITLLLNKHVQSIKYHFTTIVTLVSSRGMITLTYLSLHCIQSHSSQPHTHNNNTIPVQEI